MNKGAIQRFAIWALERADRSGVAESLSVWNHEGRLRRSKRRDGRWTRIDRR